MSNRRQRWDFAQLEPGKAVKTPQGYLRCDGYLTRVGIFQYRDAQGNVTREFRPPQEVFNKASLDSLKMVPVTMTHPPEGEVTALTAKRYQCGSVGDLVKQDGDFVQSTVMLTDAELVAATLGGDMREISCGYTCEIETAPGQWRGQDYDVVQRDIRYNHVAVVPRGRAGREVRLHIDAEGAEMVRDPKKNKRGDEQAAGSGSEAQGNGTKEQGANPLTKALKSMFKSLQDSLNSAYQDALKNMGVGDDDDDDEEQDPAAQSSDDDDDTGADETEAQSSDDDDDDGGDGDESGDHAAPDETAEQQGNKGKGTVAPATTKKDKKKDSSELEQLRGRCDALEAQLKSFKTKKTTRADAEKLQARVSRRVKLEREAAAFLGDTDLSGMSNTEIKAAVIKKVSPEVKVDADTSPAYVKGAYDLVIKTAGTRTKLLADKKAALRLVAETQQHKQDESEAAKSHDAMVKEQNEAWKQKPGA